MSEAAPTRAITIMLASIGGEGGGVMADWLVRAATRAGYPVQSTSIPGVAQRTGATVYYVELFPEKLSGLGDRRPVLSVYPGIGDVDVMVASEFAEAARAVANGFVTAERTLLIASTHRIYSTGERTAPGDGRFDDDKLRKAARDHTRRALLDDLRALSTREGVSLNAVLLGALAATEALPVSRADFAAAIQDAAIAVEANLKGFNVGFGHVFPDVPPAPPDEALLKRPAPGSAAALEERIEADFPARARDILGEGARRLVHYQDAAYGALYLNRMDAIWRAESSAGGDGRLARETARHLAVRMSYEDVIRVAQLKSAPDRFRRIRAEVKAAPGEPMIVLDYFKPGIDELAAILPPFLARPLLALSDRHGWRRRAYIGMRNKSSSITGYLKLRALAGLRRFRRGTWRYGQEQAVIEAWLADCAKAAALDLALAAEIAECATLLKGYGETFR
ncbi:MAG: indolepyruvate oxidoreductase subunit beta family protein, partial [Alphaproteobacteria bacterium]